LSFIYLEGKSEQNMQFGSIVLLKTSAGDIDIELWSKEAPEACRNFTQLCMEGYYDGTVFHRVVPEFIVQGGDPTGTGTGGELLFLTVWVSQYTVYNILRLAEVECDRDERPLNTHKIRSTEVLPSPFDDIIPREIKIKKEKNKEEGKKSQSKATKNFSLLSFGEEAEEDGDGQSSQPGIFLKSSHDLLKDDPKLSSVPVVDRMISEGSCDTEDWSNDAENKALHHRNKLDFRLCSQARQLKKELLAIKQRKEDGVKKEEDVSEGDSKPISEAVTEYLESRKKYEDKRKQKLKKGSGRESQTLALLERFKSKLSSAISESPSVPMEDVEELGEDDDKGWMAHVLNFDEQNRKVKDANMQDGDTFEIYDPRNPVNKRRREESKKLMKEKKARR
uniref:Spliceosome-associated protein CWC27 homolog n=1 Tax=Cyprinus carpio TaxID=7962 RepID=A0A8C1KUH4_CYPCA